MTQTPIEPPTTVEADADEARPWVWFLSAAELTGTRVKLAKITARAARKGFAGTIDLQAVPATRTYAPAPGALSVTVHGFDVTITGEPPRFADWQLLAAIDKVGDGAVIRYLPGVEQDIPNNAVRPGECDHCRTRRPRTSVLLVEHETTGERRQVGSSCLKDFLGWSTYPVFITTDELCDELAPIRSSRPVGDLDLESILTYSWAVVAKHGWTPARAAADARTATRDLVSTVIHGGRGSNELLDSIQPHLDEGHRMAPVIIDTLTTAFTDPTGYEANLAAIMKAGRVEPRHLGLAVSAVPAYLHITQPQATAEGKTGRDVVGYAGEVGEKVTLTGTIKQLFHVDGFTWHSPSRRMLIVDCGTSVAKMITGASWAYDVERGYHITITGTVRKHEDWHGTPQTVIVRPKLITNHSTPPEPDPPAVAAVPAMAAPARAPLPEPRPMASDQPTGWDTVTETGPRRRFPGPPHPHAPTLARGLTP